MQEQVKSILFDFKCEGWSVQKLEKELGFSNGSLGKAASGKVNLSEVRFIRLLKFYQDTFKHTPTLSEGLKSDIKENGILPKKETTDTKEMQPKDSCKPKNIPANEPKEGSGAFYLKYGVMTYAEIKNKK